MVVQVINPTTSFTFDYLSYETYVNFAFGAFVNAVVAGSDGG